MSKVKKIFYNPYFYYSPIIIFTWFFSSQILKISPIKCLLGSIEEQCLFYNYDAYLIYHFFNIINLLFLLYTTLYLYYNIILKKDVVGKLVKKVYHRTTKQYYIRKKRKRIIILLFCYLTALIISYARFPIIILKILC